MEECWEMLKSLLMQMKEENEKVVLKLNIQKTEIMAPCPITSWQVDRETVERVTDLFFSGAPKSLQMLTAAWKKSYDQSRQHIKKQRHYFVNKDPLSQNYGFSSSHMWMWEMDYKECWVLKNWCLWPVVLEKTLESPLNCKEMQTVHPKGNQSWMLIGRIDAEAETLILWPPDVKNWIIWKEADSGNNWRQKEKGTTGNEMVGWHHWLNGLEFEKTLGVGNGQGGLVCCSPCSCKESDTTEQLNWAELNKQALAKNFSWL